jgi:DNA segregation ATPase FtsK/SpoIIIE, S-DNA-T family
MNDRYERLRELPHDLCPEGKLTPAIARSKRLGMPLRLVCIDEVQRYLEHPEHGKIIL